MDRRKAKLFVEGIADKKFFEDYLKFAYDVSLDEHDITVLGGWTKIENLEETLGEQATIHEMKKNVANGDINLVIFDADKDPSARRTAIEEIKRRNGLDFELFLLPDNTTSGALEELLMSAINPVNQPVCDCWTRYEADLARQRIPWKNPQTPTVPAKKTQVYAYLEALLGETRKEKKLIKEANRNYRKPEHWDLTAAGLHPLREFLDKFFSENNES